MVSTATSPYRLLQNVTSIGDGSGQNGSMSGQENTYGGNRPNQPLNYKPWPWFIWLILKIVGLYNYRRIVTQRRCHLCRLSDLERRRRERGVSEDLCGSYPGAACSEELQGGSGGEDRLGDDVQPPLFTVDGNMNFSSGEEGSAMTGKSCAACQSEWWDARGKCQPYSETDNGVKRWNHFGSTVLSLLWPLALISLIMYDLCYYVRDYWGDEQQLVRLISYSTYLFFNVSSPFLSLVANVRNMLLDYRGTFQHQGYCWWGALSIRYIVKRLQYLDLAKCGLPYKHILVLCFIWPCFNGLHRAAIYYIYVEKASKDVHIKISLTTGLMSMIVFGNFCYIMLLLRLSFQKQAETELAFLWKNVGKVDDCRRRLVLYAEELGSMSRLVSIWIVAVVAVSTWAFTSLINWNYRSMKTHVTKPSVTAIEININVLIWSENIMFLVLPLVAIGGWDMNSIWIRFQRSISRMRSEAQELFWSKILCFCAEQSPVYSVTLTLVFSALGLYLGLHFGEQNVGYWTRRGINASTINYPRAGP